MGYSVLNKIYTILCMVYILLRVHKLYICNISFIPLNCIYPIHAIYPKHSLYIFLEKINSPSHKLYILYAWYIPDKVYMVYNGTLRATKKLRFTNFVIE